MREDPKIHGTDAERKLFTTENPAWKKAASKLAEAGIGVDFFIGAPGGAYTDVATIGILAWAFVIRETSGLIKPLQDISRVSQEVRHSSTPTSMHHEICSRCGGKWPTLSTGIRVTSA